MRTLGKYIKPYLWRIALQMTVKISGTVIELFLPGMLSIILDEYAPWVTRPACGRWAD